MRPSRGWAVKTLLACAVLAVPLVTSDPYHLQVASAAGIGAIMAISLGLLYGHTGQMSFAHAGFMGIGAYASALLTTDLGLDFWLSLIPAVLLPGMVAYAVGLPTLRLRGHYLAVATLVLGLGVNSFFVQASAITHGTVGVFGMERPELLGLRLESTGQFYVVIAAGALLTYLAAERIVNSRFGRALRAVAQDETAASAVAIATGHYKTLVFTVTAMMAGLAGALFAHQLLFISPVNFEISTSITVLSMVVIGGAQSIAGTVIGAIFVTLLRQFLFGAGDLEFLFFGALIVITLIFFPSGIHGLARSTLRRGSTLVRDWAKTGRAHHAD